jgi:hypothetical protein
VIEPPPTRQNHPPPPTRWPWVVVGVIAVGSFAAYGCFVTGVISFGVLLGTIELIVCGGVVVAGIVAGIKYGTQDKDYWA